MSLGGRIQKPYKNNYEVYSFLSLVHLCPISFGGGAGGM